MLTIREASEKYNININTLRKRLKTTNATLQECATRDVVFQNKNHCFKGEVFSSLVGTGEKRVSAKGTSEYEFQCICGKKLWLRAHKVKSGAKKRCGYSCSKKIITLKQTFLKEYGAWKNIIARCTFKSHKYYRSYGGRGIIISEEFKNSFETFLKHVGPCPQPDYSIDRINNLSGNYERGNLRWADKSTQARNTRSCKKYQVTINILNELLGNTLVIKKCLKSDKTASKFVGTRVYNIWQGIKNRVFNSTGEDYLNYGGRGISMHEDFQRSYYAFLSHVGTPPDNSYTLDRIDNDGDYTYDNLRWAKRKVQNNNRRTVAHSEKIIEDLKHQCDERGISYEGVLE